MDTKTAKQDLCNISSSVVIKSKDIGEISLSVCSFSIQNLNDRDNIFRTFPNPIIKITTAAPIPDNLIEGLLIDLDVYFNRIISYSYRNMQILEVSPKKASFISGRERERTIEFAPAQQ